MCYRKKMKKTFFEMKIKLSIEHKPHQFPTYAALHVRK
jgi:hypothetical protein